MHVSNLTSNEKVSMGMVYVFANLLCRCEVVGGGVYKVGLAIACFNLTSNEKVSIFFLANLLCRCTVVGGGVYKVGLVIFV